ncbi:MAG: hypothetical protein ABI425_03660 [Patescibacteria group bacterium]
MRDEIQYWKVKSLLLSGSSYEEVKKEVDQFFLILKGKTKRKMSIRSRYFRKRKVFFDYFWDHIFQKPKKQRLVRLKLVSCAIELIKNTTLVPSQKINPNKSSEILYRFYGLTTKKNVFVLQIKDTGKSLQFLSVFPWK